MLTDRFVVFFALAGMALSTTACKVKVCNNPSSTILLIIQTQDVTVPDDALLVVDATIQVPQHNPRRRHMVIHPGPALADGLYPVTFDPAVGSVASNQKFTVTISILLLDANKIPVAMGRYEKQLDPSQCYPKERLVIKPLSCQNSDDGTPCRTDDGHGGACKDHRCVEETCGTVDGIQTLAGELCDGDAFCTETCQWRPILLDLGNTNQDPSWLRMVGFSSEGSCSVSRVAGAYGSGINGAFLPPASFSDVLPFSLALADLVGAINGNISSGADSQFIVGRPGYRNAQQAVGHVLVSELGFLSGGGVLRDFETQTELFGWNGSEDGAPDPKSLLGSHVVAGDVDADGLGDVVASAPLAGDDNKGAVFAFLSSTSYDGQNWTAMSGVVRIEGNSKSAFGQSLQVADMDGDGAMDILVGAPADSAGRGYVAIYRGGVGALGGEAGAPTAAMLLKGPGVYTAFGASLTTGDIDGDMKLDLIVGQPGGLAGKISDKGVNRPTVVILSDPGRFFQVGRTTTCDNLETCGIATILLQEPTDTATRRFGAQTAAGDLDQDGFSDIAVSAPQTGTTGDSDRVYVYSGRDVAMAIETGDSSDIMPQLVLDGPLQAGFGARLLIDDVNGDRIPDLVVAAPLRDLDAATPIPARPNAGAVYVLLGSAKWSWKGPDNALDMAELDSIARPPKDTNAPQESFHGYSALVVWGPRGGAQLGAALAAGPIFVPDAQSTEVMLALGVGSSPLPSLVLQQACGIVLLNLSKIAQVSSGLVPCASSGCRVLNPGLTCSDLGDPPSCRETAESLSTYIPECQNGVGCSN